MIDILNLIPGKKKKTPSGWTTFNAVCCHHRGHKQDKRMRGGVRFTEHGGWVYHCFNCQHKCSLKVGATFSRALRQLFEWLNIDKEQVDKWSFESFQQRNMLDIVRQRQTAFVANFRTVELPFGSFLLDSADPEHQPHIEYLQNRGVDPFSYPFYVTPDAEGRESQRIIIPYYYEDRLVGYTSRFYDGRIPKYISEQQRGYVFNVDNQDPEWSVCILVEGQFDAISIGGCAYMGSNISDEQAQMLSRMRKTIIVVPDRDKAGLQICDRALQLGYQVSLPPWSSDVKDVNDAVNRYGRLATTLSILQFATSSKIKIEMTRKKLL
jgi:DNA primase